MFDNSVLSKSLFVEEIELSGKKYELSGIRVSDKFACAIVLAEGSAEPTAVDSQELALIKAWITLEVSKRNLEISEANAASGFDRLLKSLEETQTAK